MLLMTSENTARNTLSNQGIINCILLVIFVYYIWVRPVVTYGSESWTLSMEQERALAVFERKILRKIYEPVKENELWRIRRSDELEAIIKGENVVRFIKCQRIRWLGHIEKMQDTAIPKKMYGKLYATRRRGRPKMRWLDDVSMDLRKMGLTLRLLMPYIYGAPILDVSRSHTTTQHSR